MFGRGNSNGWRAFKRDRSGNVAMLWALMGSGLVGLVGMTVDFTRAQALRTQMQNAADGAALVAERNSNLPLEQREAAAQAYFDAEMGDRAGAARFDVIPLESGGHRVEAFMEMPLGLTNLINHHDWTIAVSSEAEAQASPPIEVALVLDNTGSMSRDMGDLRDAAEDLADYLLRLDGDTVKVSLVPFVAQVNIGNDSAHLAWMDTTGVAPMNGELLEDRMIGYASRSGTNDCTTNLPDRPGGYTGPYRLSWVRGGVNGNSGRSNRCYGWTPEDGINYFTLFNLMRNDQWKGCVETRPEPYDITDAPPSIANPATLFVPFFWLDTTDGYSNSYLSDTDGDFSGVTMGTNFGSGSPDASEQRQARMLNVFKWRNQNASLDTTAPDTRGPNRGCPTPIVPLTSNHSSVINAIRNMSHWNGGGTNQMEGLAWGWRVLSPGAPFTQGAPYGETRKVIVLMSDGENTNVGSDPVLASDYAALNHLGMWRDFDDGGGLIESLLGGILRGVLPVQYRRDINSSSQYVSYVNSRQAQLCNNIKNEGIEIYTVIFRETDRATENLMRNCASSSEHFFRADNASELNAAFNAIGSGIGSLRLTH